MEIAACFLRKLTAFSKLASAKIEPWDVKFLYVDSEDWSDCVDEQADLCLHLVHMSEGTFSHVLVQYHHIYPKYWDRQVWANSVDPDLTLQNLAFDQYLLILLFLKHINSCPAE